MARDLGGGGRVRRRTARPPRRYRPRQDDPRGQGAPSTRGDGSSSSDRGGSGGSRGGNDRGRAPLGPNGESLPRNYSVKRPNYWDLTFGKPNYWKQTFGRQRRGFGIAEIKPRYFDGDQYRPGSRDVNSIIDMQRRLVAAGFLDPGDMQLGVWTGKTITAYEGLLGYANMVGLDADSALLHAASANQGALGEGGEGGGGGGGGGEGGFTFDPETGEMIPITETFVPPPLELRTTNKDDLRAVMRQATTLLGKGFSEAEINELVDAYNWREIKAQKDAYDTEVGIMRQEFDGTSPGGQVYTPTSAAREVEVPSPDTFLDMEARRRDPAGYQATQIAEEFAPAFFDALGGYF